jgi:hypothetical protein
MWPSSEAAILIENALWAQSSSKSREDKRPTYKSEEAHIGLVVGGFQKFSVSYEVYGNL